MARAESFDLGLKTEVPASETPKETQRTSPEKPTTLEAHAEHGAAIRERTVANVKNAVTKFASLGSKMWSGMKRIAGGTAKAVDTGIGLGAAGLEAAGNATERVASFVAEAPDVAMDKLGDGLNAAAEWTTDTSLKGLALANEGYVNVAAFAERGIDAASRKAEQAKEAFGRGVGHARAFGNGVRSAAKSGQRMALEQMRALLVSKVESIDRKLQQLDAMNNLEGELNFSA